MIIQKTVVEISSTFPSKEVYEDVKKLWRDQGLGNDYCYYPIHMYDAIDDTDNDFSEYPALRKWLIENFTDPKQEILIHWWW